MKCLRMSANWQRKNIADPIKCTRGNITKKVSVEMKNSDMLNGSAKQSKKRKRTELESLYDDLQTVYQKQNKGFVTGDCKDVCRSRRTISKQNLIDQQKKSKSIEKKLVPRGQQFSKGDFVIGDIKSFGWWYGKIAESSVKGKPKDLVLVYWYGDHKTLEYPRSHLLSYYKFSTVYEKSKKPLYRKAVQEFLKEIHAYHKANGLDAPESLKPSTLIDWAMNDFQEESDVSEQGQTSDDCEALNSLGKPTVDESPTKRAKDAAIESSCTNKKTDPSQTKSSVITPGPSVIEISVKELEQSYVNVEDSFEENNQNIDEIVTKENCCDDMESSSQVSLGMGMDLADNESSTSTVHYDLMETCEHSKQINNKPKSNREEGIAKNSKKDKLDGIELDYSLVGKSPAKRGCTMKDTTIVPLPVEKKSKKRQRKQDHKPFLDLPVLSSTSKILSWNCNATSTPVKNYDDDNLMMKDSPDKSIRINDLVIAKLKGFDWWFGKIVSYQRARKSPPAEGSCWIYWYGDHKLSEIPLSSCEHLDQFSVRFLPKKLRGQYLTSVEEALNEAALRCGKVGVSVHLPREEQIEQLKELIEWAMDGFQPHGVDALRSPIEVVNQLEREVDGSDKDSNNMDNAHDNDEINFIPVLNEEIKLLFDRVAAGKANIEDLCLACGDTKVFASHPLFEGGLCKECKESFLESAFLYDDSGSQMYCCICSEGDHIFMCDNIGCQRSYCPVCIDMLCGVGYSERISSSEEEWRCFMCEEMTVRLLKVRNDWQDRLKEIFNEERNHIDFGPQVYYDPVPFEERKPIRVLSLFDGIATALHVLQKMNFDIELYVAAEIDCDALKVAETHHARTIRHVGDVCKITEKQMEEWGPFDLLVGGSPCNDLSIANPLRKGIYDGTGRLFFEYYRILQYAMNSRLDHAHQQPRPFFWLFENVVGMRYDDRDVITRFLQCNPTIISAKDLSPQQRVRYYWGNLPGMNRPLCGITGQSLSLQDCLEPNCGRTAKVEKVRCITTKRTSLKQQTKLVLPVHLEHSVTQQTEDELWITEVERIFGFPEHYTDIGNMGQRQRQKLLGKSWSVPVIQHLLMPLKDYFKTKPPPPPPPSSSLNCGDDNACARRCFDAQTQTDELMDVELNSLTENDTHAQATFERKESEIASSSTDGHNLHTSPFSEQDEFYGVPLTGIAEEMVLV
ncbi:DNA (cytosine-5)-methyltransferase 3B-like isoform X2 [Clytia hemisphaerica]|uniref:DNA (cytosine-5)-methyltransferase 3B-like isoform X2 n=1 Tax=Clytia hemisphaerica TaxID=252671 RepID=UPI0034D777B5